MHKRVTVTCKTCKLYEFPPYILESGYFHTKKLQMKHTFACPCVKENERNEVDSLRGMRARNKTHDIDDKISNLRTELTSLVGECSKLQAGNNNSDSNPRFGIYNNEVSGIKQVHRSYEGSISFSGGRVDVNLQHGKQKQKKTDNRSEKREFTKWLDSTIDSLSGTVKSNGDKVKPAPTSKNVIPDRLDDQGGRRDGSVITKAAKELVYESFVVKSYPHYVPNAEVQEVAVQPINLSKRKHEKTEESRHPSVKKTKISDKKQGNPKVKTLIIHDSSDSEVEVINIDDDSNCSPPVNNEVDHKEDKPKVVEIIDNEPTPEKGETQKGNSCSTRGVWECPICFEHNIGQEVVTTMCGHVFCKKCLDDYYVTYNRICPTCRTDLHDKPVITLFNF